MSIWDDPQFTPAPREETDYVKFVTIGDTVQGKVVQTGKSQFKGRDVPSLHIETNSGVKRLDVINKALKDELWELRPEVGDLIKIRFKERKTLVDGHINLFDVKVQKQGQPTPEPVSTPSPPPVVAAADPFDF